MQKGPSVQLPACTWALVVPVPTKALNTPPGGSAAMGTVLRNALIWGVGTWLGFPPSFRGVFHQGSQCLSLSWRLNPAAEPGVEAPGSRLEEPSCLLPWGSKLCCANIKKRAQRFWRPNLRLACKLWLLARGDRVSENAGAGAEAITLPDKSAVPSVTLRLL